MTCKQLPAELLERVITAGYRGNPVLDIYDRVRCLAVCKLWREALSFRRMPLPSLELCPRQGYSDPVTEWVCRTQPGVQVLDICASDVLAFNSLPFQAAYRALLSLQPREALQVLRLHMTFSALQPLWPAISLFPCLRQLDVSLPTASGVMDASWFSSLPPSLEVLEVGHPEEVIIASNRGLLPSLTYLMVGHASKLEIDAVLHSLRELATEDVVSTQLTGAQLQLPHLTRLCICSDRVDIGDLQRMPSLQVLHFPGGPPAAAPGLAALSDLTSLELCLTDSEDTGPVSELLQLVPAQLAHLGLFITWDFWGAPASVVTEAVSRVAPALRSLTQLTSFSTNNTALLPSLALLPHLRCLRLQHTTAGQLSIQDADFLAGLRGLQQLTFGDKMLHGEESARRLQDNCALFGGLSCVICVEVAVAEKDPMLCHP